MITTCASVQIWENDDLPNQICNGCFLQLQNTINFKQLCENSDNAFRQIIAQNGSNLWIKENNLNQVKNEENDGLNYPIYIKQEDDDENITNEDTKKSTENSIEETVEIKKEDKSESNRIKTRKKKVIHYKSEEESDSYENVNGDNDSSYDSENEKLSDLRQQLPEINEYKCETCSKTFKKVDALGWHNRKTHKAAGLKCGRCSMVCYHLLHLRAHEKSHNKCRICHLRFSTRKKLIQHRLTHADDDIPEVTCELCSSKLANRNSLYKHMRFVHNQEKLFKKTPQCETCQEIFQNKRILEKHVRKMHPKKKTPKEKSKYKEELANCEVCGKTVRRRNLRLHMLSHREYDNVTCRYCEKSFMSPELLTEHVQVSHKKCLCDHCGLRLRSNQLKKHLLTHTKERPYACDKCDKTYRTNFQLKEHVSRVHLNERNFVCTFCSQAFFDKKILLKHVMRHTGEKPFKCQMCEKRFIQKVALDVHMKTHTNLL
ncbi:zinc finger protein 260-like isoform X3 [Chrysoperla carnea]|uniref:zinc finger protein 260-like isoform X3 n=1 Tax=Chrysoperla carnea TaxID=189513 RepID=UPI001D05DDAB|nr:zinc finger protein 260-like isoform X3 [Chrysoperla carnea]